MSGISTATASCWGKGQLMSGREPLFFATNTLTACVHACVCTCASVCASEWLGAHTSKHGRERPAAPSYVCPASQERCAGSMHACTRSSECHSPFKPTHTPLVGPCRPAAAAQRKRPRRAGRLCQACHPQCLHTPAGRGSRGRRAQKEGAAHHGCKAADQSGNKECSLPALIPASRMCQHAMHGPSNAPSLRCCRASAR